MDYKDSVNNRFVEACDAVIRVNLVENKARLSELLDIKSNKLSEILSGRMRAGVTEIQKLCGLFGVSFDYLFNGNGEVFLTEKETPITLQIRKPQTLNLKPQLETPIAEFDPHVSVVRAKTITEADQGIPLIPLEAAAGPFLGNSAQIFDYDCERYVVPEFSKADFLIRITGDSMEPYYIAGDMVACKKLNLDTFFQWNEVYLIDSEQGVLIKRVKPGSTPATLSLVSDNKAYDPVELERAEVYGLARVLGLLRFN